MRAPEQERSGWGYKSREEHEGTSIELRGGGRRAQATIDRVPVGVNKCIDDVEQQSALNIKQQLLDDYKL